MQREPPQQDVFEDIRSKVNMALFWAIVHSTVLSVFLRKPGTMGARHFGSAPGALGVPYTLIWASLSNSPEMMHFALAYIFMMAVHSVCRARKERDGHLEAEWFIGDSVFGPRGYAKAEPLVCGVIALLIADAAPPLAAFLAVGSMALVINYQSIRMREEAELRAIRQSLLEQQRVERLMRRAIGDD